MTTIVASNREIVADTLVTLGDGRITFIEKLVYYPDKDEVLGGVGSLPVIQKMMRWYKAGAKPGKWKMPPKDFDANMLVFERNGVVVEYHSHRSADLPITYSVRPFTLAFGSGAPLAQTAIGLGLSPEQAVEHAIRYDPGTGGKLQVWNWEATKGHVK